MRFEELDLNYLLAGEVLHLTGITPALSDSCQDLVERLMRKANERGTLVSFDVNIRWRLFEGRDPKEVLERLIAHADLLFLSDEEAELLLEGSDTESLRRTREDLRAQTMVVHEAGGAFAVDGNTLIEMKGYSVEVVDTVGAGDAFVAVFCRDS